MPLKTKNTKGIELFCASPASTAICKSTITKPLHRLNSYLGDHCKNLTNNMSQLPLTPRKLERSHPNHDPVPRRKSSADVYDLRDYHKKHSDHYTSNYSHSSRYLLGDSPFLDSLSSHSDYPAKESLALLPTPVVRSKDRELRKSRSQTGRVGLSLMDGAPKETNYKKTMSLVPLANQSDQQVITGSHASKSSSFAPSTGQVVALRVSLHCKACEAKLRKHLSKMEGVTSFSIDMETKKVTVVGKVTPSDVLTSISKVKSARFWPSPSSSSPTSSSS